MDRETRANMLAQEVIALAQSTLMVHIRFLDRGLAALKPTSHDKLWFATDGAHLYYDSWYILGKYKWEQNAICRALLHSLLHCVFRHGFIGKEISHSRWDLACDIAVEAAINDMGKSFLSLRRAEQQIGLVSLLLQELQPPLTAERIYRWLEKREVTEEELVAQREPFLADQHDLWYGTYTAGPDSDTEIDLEQVWQEISHRMQVEMETIAKDDGSILVQSLRQVNRKKHNYTEFLKRFGVYGEVMRISEEEFDYTYYTYGISTYGNVPLIEPLEYREQRRLREFVIAIDTSGSVRGDVVQSFIQHTYNILSQQENLFTKVDIHIIQCDDRIREDAHITSVEAFQQYLDTMEIKGLGNTDFRPVFQHIEELRHKGELLNLKGLLYFTDGRGVFPATKPPYETAFVLHQDAWDTPEVPRWAIKLIVTEDDILDQRFGSE